MRMRAVSVHRPWGVHCMHHMQLNSVSAWGSKYKSRSRDAWPPVCLNQLWDVKFARGPVFLLYRFFRLALLSAPEHLMNLTILKERDWASSYASMQQAMPATPRNGSRKALCPVRLPCSQCGLFSHQMPSNLAYREFLCSILSETAIHLWLGGIFAAQGSWALLLLGHCMSLTTTCSRCSLSFCSLNQLSKPWPFLLSPDREVRTFELPRPVGWASVGCSSMPAWPSWLQLYKFDLQPGSSTDQVAGEHQPLKKHP